MKVNDNIERLRESNYPDTKALNAVAILEMTRLALRLWEKPLLILKTIHHDVWQRSALGIIVLDIDSGFLGSWTRPAMRGLSNASGRRRAEKFI
ncbi:MAG: hypothetical protein MUO26_00650 [Methanotrichaceae archaeon]|nr:hypothetical protein [Methanotrichaceae archaeon]